jgi:2TM domain-containing protein
MEVVIVVDTESRETNDLRARALEQIEKKRGFVAHLFAYLLVNTFLVVIWAVTGADFFWPIFPILGWGIGVFFHGWDVYSGGPSEDQIRREMDRLQHR